MLAARKKPAHTLDMIAQLAFAAILASLPNQEGRGSISCFGLNSGSGSCSLKYEIGQASWMGSLRGARYVGSPACPTGKSIEFVRGQALFRDIRWVATAGSICVPSVGSQFALMGRIIWRAGISEEEVEVTASPYAVTESSYIGSSSLEISPW